ncbi:hypothetical protein U9M48_041224 [Paspalum notatum var. saurae]|uniref:Uncharacterized protein n=1 Tax=Paspalum notatum var. saurae TaxID=547442 RepID=A0AAQ3UNR8_PASNO
MGILDGSTPALAKTIQVQKEKDAQTMPNPDYDSWLAKDQQLLSYLVNSITKEVLPQVASATSASGAWKALEGMFSASSKARVTNLRMQLSTLKKGNMSTAAYFTKMRSIQDELAAIGKVIEDNEMVSYILTGLDFDYNPIVSSILSRGDSITLSDLYSQLLAYDLRWEINEGHEARRCWYRYDEDEDQQNPKSAGAATAGYGYDTNWYADSGATDHVTSELEKLTVRDKYTGHDQVHTASGTGSGIEENPARR